MKKIIGLLFVLVLGIGGYFGYRYCHDRYVGTTAYAIVPKEVPQKEAEKDMDGNLIRGRYVYRYTFNFVKENGEKQKMEFGLRGENPTPFTPGSYVTAKIGSEIVAKGPNDINADKIPKDIKQKLDSQ